MRLDDSALTYAPVRECATKCPVQLRMHRHQPRLVALAGSYPDRRIGGIEGQVAHFEVERLGHAKAGPSLLQHQQLRLRIRRSFDDGVHLVGFEVLRYALLAFGACADGR